MNKEVFRANCENSRPYIMPDVIKPYSTSEYQRRGLKVLKNEEHTSRGPLCSLDPNFRCGESLNGIQVIPTKDKYQVLVRSRVVPGSKVRKFYC